MKLYKTTDNFVEFMDEYGYGDDTLSWLRTHSFNGEVEKALDGSPISLSPDLVVQTPTGRATIVFDDYKEVKDFLPEELFKL